MVQFYHDAHKGEPSLAQQPLKPLKTSDAFLLGACVLGILLGLSLISYQVAIVAGIAALTYVVVKLLTT